MWGGDPATRHRTRWRPHFNPRPPCGGRLRVHQRDHGHRHFNPRPPCGGRRLKRGPHIDPSRISIHAPRVGGDDRHRVRLHQGVAFQSTPPVWGATPSMSGPMGNFAFQSMPPVWGATRTPRICFWPISDFNPRPPCGGRLCRAPCAASAPYFNPRPPCGGRLDVAQCRVGGAHISIHAPRVGGDLSGLRLRIEPAVFQSTPPVWGATSL